jgi:hypothetical protein
MKTHGPQGRSEADVVNPKAMFVSTDMVAVDTAATKFFGQIQEMPLDSVGHIANGAAHKLGTMDLESLTIKRISL